MVMAKNLKWQSNCEREALCGHKQSLLFGGRWFVTMNINRAIDKNRVGVTVVS